jgi:hypothetical protein
MSTVNSSYIGVGKVHARLFGTAGAFRHVGNVSKLLLKQELTEVREQDYTRLGGGARKIIKRLKAVQAETTWLSFDAANMALAVAGTTTNVASGAVVVGTPEVVKSYKGTLVRLANPPLAITSVKDSAGTTTYVAGTDYELSVAGINILPGTAIVDGADLKVAYTFNAYDQIEAATATSSIMEVIFEGLNEADSGSPMVVEIWKLNMPPANELSLIGDALSELTFSCEALKDTTKPANVSPFFRVRKG